MKAVVAWSGLVVMGPVPPVVVLIVSWSKRGSAARRHALAAVVMWVVILAVYLPVWVVGVMMHLDRPETYAIVVAVVCFVVTLCISTVGALLAWRMPVIGSMSDPATPAGPTPEGDPS